MALWCSGNRDISSVPMRGFDSLRSQYHVWSALFFSCPTWHCGSMGSMVLFLFLSVGSSPTGATTRKPVWFSVARTFSNISRSSLILEGAVVPCISAAMNGTSSGSRVGYLSVTDIIATIIAGTVDDDSKVCYLCSPLFFYTHCYFLPVFVSNLLNPS